MPDLLERLTAALGDRYAIEAEIGRGGMATVFLAEDLKHHRKVAIKVLHPELAAAVGSHRFLREIDTVAALDHPHILPLYDSGERSGVLFYVMPYVEGESLRDRMAREKQLPVDEAVRITREIADALTYAHGHGVIHRDIKPENVLLSAGHARVADFGVARAITRAGERRVTATGMAVGTPAYMSPEQGSGEEADERSDIYALGCVLYEMLSGDVPLPAPTPQAVQARRMSENPPSLHPMRDTVPALLDQVIGRALARLPADRWETAEQFSAALDRCVSVVSTTQVLARDRREPRSRRQVALAGLLAIAAIATTLVVSRHFISPRLPDTATTPRMVVLPFANLGPTEDEYFADGMTEEITARIAVLPGLSVISRQSAMHYKTTNKSLSEIGDELDVQFILEGTIRWSRDEGLSRVRVTPQLIRVEDDTHIWAEVFDEDLTEVFAVQSAIAGQVAQALGIVLDADSRETLSKVPTGNMEAYDLYLRAQEFFDRSYALAPLEVARSLYTLAIELDPQFAQAHAMLAYADLKYYWHEYDRSPERLESAKRAADIALALSPDSPEGHLALGFYYYYGFRDYGQALRHFTLAGSHRPNDPEVVQSFAWVYRRQGRMREALDACERAMSLDPLSATAAYNLAETHHLVRDHASAREALELSIQLQPEFSWPPFELLSVYVGTGDTAQARLAARKAVARERPPGWPHRYWWTSGALHRILGSDYEEMLKQVLGAKFGGDTAAQLLADRRFAEAREYLEEAAGRTPREPRVHGQLAMAYVGIGLPEEAIEAAERAVELLPLDADAFDGPEAVGNLAQVFAMTGDVAGAIEQLEVLLSKPGRLTVEWLHADPVWDLIRDDRRFQRFAGEVRNTRTTSLSLPPPG